MQYDNDLKTQIRTFVAIALAMAVGLIGANAATASFNDVPAEGQFSESINRVQEAGIATGYADGTFRPREDINRQQTAAWLDRSLARVGAGFNGQGQTLSASNPTVVISEVEMTSPATESGSGWLTIQGGVGGVSAAPGATCPCRAAVIVRDETDRVVGQSMLTAFADPAGEAVTIAPVYAVTPIAGGATHTYRLTVELLDLTQEISVAGVIYAQYAPMADGEPGGFGEATRTDTVESLVP
jgi:hypothetical protein